MAPKSTKPAKITAATPETIALRAEVEKLHEAARRQRVDADEAAQVIKRLRADAIAHESSLGRVWKWLGGA